MVARNGEAIAFDGMHNGSRSGMQESASTGCTAADLMTDMSTEQADRALDEFPGPGRELAILLVFVVCPSILAYANRLLD